MHQSDISSGHIKKLNDSDTGKLQQQLLLFSHVFNQKHFSMPSTIHLQKMLANPHHLVFVATLNDAVIGGLTAYLLPEFETETSLVYIYDLAVQTEHQRKGIGKQLIASINKFCKQQGITEVFVQAEEKDEYAVNFYRKTGGKEMKVIQFAYAL